MSIWKSPIFYLSILLLLAVSGAVLAPFIVDWSTYRADLERYGERLSGRAVRINGPISVSLFPFPQLRGERVSIATTDDPNSPVFVDADRVTVRVALAGLLQWQLRVEDIAVDNPVIRLERDANGNVNWMMQPQEALRTSRLLETVRLDRIVLNDGKLTYVDRTRAGTLEVGIKEAVFSAPSIEGPWRSTGTITAYGLESGYSFASSAVVRSDQPVKIGFKLQPKNPDLPVFGFEGSRSGASLLGNIRIEPGLEDGKTDTKRPTTGLASLKFTSAVEATADRINLSNVQIVPAKSDDSSTLIQGQMSATIGQRVSASAELNGTRVNLDSLIGGAANLSRGDLLKTINAALSGLPETVDAAFVFDLASVKLQGETLESIVLAGDMNKQALRVKRLSANLPGRSRVLLDGTVFAGAGSSEAAGKVAFESNDLRQFVTWKWSGAKPQAAAYWTGSRGQFKLQSDFKMADDALRLSQSQFELDGQRGSVDLALLAAGPAAIEAQVRIASLDIDSFLRRPGGGTTVVKAADIVGLLGSLLHDTNMTLGFDAGTVMLNGVRASSVRFDGETGAKGLTVRSLDVSLLGDARLTAQGDMSLAEGLPQGSFDGAVTAGNPLPLLQLLGVLNAENASSFQRGLGATNATGRLVFGQSETGPVANVTAKGKSGALTFDTSLTVSDLASTSGMTYKGVADVSAADDLTLLAMAGFDMPVSDQRPGRIKIAFDGNRQAGIGLSAEGELLSAAGTFEGVYTPAVGDFPQIDGVLKFSGTDTGKVMKALGAPLVAAPAGAFSASARIKPQTDALRFEQVEGLIAGEPFSGELDWKRDHSISSDFTVESITMHQLLAGLFLPWTGAPASLDSSFDGTPPFGIKGEFWLRPKQFEVISGVPLTETVIGVVIEGRERQVTLAARDATGAQVKAEAAMLPSGGQYTIEMTGDVPLDLKSLFTFADGTSNVGGSIRLSAKASGNGMSPGAVLTDLSGEGRVTTRGVTIKTFTPEQFAAGMKGATSSDHLRAGIEALQSAADYALADGDVPLKIALGRMTLEPFTRDTGASTQTFEVSVDLQDRTMTALASVAVKDLADVPPAKLWFEGALGALRKRVETSAIAAKLGYAIMAREMEELERAQQEQQRIIEQEEAQRKLDVERFRAYQEQKAELRLRQRELRVHAGQREIDAAAAKEQLTAQLTSLAAMSKLELARRNRIVRVQQATADGALSKPVRSRRTFVTLDQLPDGFQIPQDPPLQP